MVNLF